MDAETLKWQQRAKQVWLKNEDLNTKFFHNCASQKKKVNTISRIQSSSGQEASDPQEIGHVFQQFFTDLYSTSRPIGIGDCLATMEQVVTDDMNYILSKAFTAEEIKTTIFSMNPLGFPRPDGFPTKFSRNTGIQWVLESVR